MRRLRRGVFEPPCRRDRVAHRTYRGGKAFGFLVVVRMKMKTVRVVQPKQPLEIVEVEAPEPGEGRVRIKVEACGICHSDSLTVEGTWPGIAYPRTPGHEVAGTIEATGPNADPFKP